jgi:hypothetical protein
MKVPEIMSMLEQGVVSSLQCSLPLGGMRENGHVVTSLDLELPTWISSSLQQFESTMACQCQLLAPRTLL